MSPFLLRNCCDHSLRKQTSLYPSLSTSPVRGGSLLSFRKTYLILSSSLAPAAFSSTQEGQIAFAYPLLLKLTGFGFEHVAAGRRRKVGSLNTHWYRDCRYLTKARRQKEELEAEKRPKKRKKAKRKQSKTASLEDEDSESSSDLDRKPRAKHPPKQRKKFKFVAVTKPNVVTCRYILCNTMGDRSLGRRAELDTCGGCPDGQRRCDVSFFVSPEWMRSTRCLARQKQAPYTAV
jgi:hypothetical protein